MLEQCSWWDVLCDIGRLIGSQSVEEAKPVAVEVGLVAEKEKLIDGGEDLQSNQSTYK